MMSKFVSESSNSFRFAKSMYGLISFMKSIISCFFSGRRGSSVPVFSFPKIDEASFIFSISFAYSSFVTSSARNDVWNLTSSMYLWRASSFALSIRTRGR